MKCSVRFRPFWRLTRTSANVLKADFQHFSPLSEQVIAPNTRRVYWKGYVDVRVVRIDISEHFAVPHSLTLQFGTATARPKMIGAEHVPDGLDGVLKDLV